MPLSPETNLEEIKQKARNIIEEKKEKIVILKKN